MKQYPFTSFIADHSDVDKDLMEEWVAACKTTTIAKDGFLLRQGELCQHAFYVAGGLLKYYSIDEKGKEHILQFAPEGWLVSDRESVYFNRPSQFFIQALEDSTVTLLDETFIIRLSQNNPSFLTFHNRLLHNHIRQLQNRVNMLLSATAEERYLSFIKVYPDIMLRVPQWMVASYLGITPESLSRVRKELATRNAGR